MRIERKIELLKRRLAEVEENLALVQVRISEFVQPTDVPLQLIKDEQDLQEGIEDLRGQLARLGDQLERAANLAAQAQHAERDRRWDDAAASYEAVLEIDPEDEAAREGLARVQRVQAHISESLAQAAQAERDVRWDDAVAGYEAVLEVDPEDEAAREGLARVRQMQADVAGSLAQGEQAEREEQWDQAIASYASVLEVNPENQVALEGLVRARRARRRASVPWWAWALGAAAVLVLIVGALLRGRSRPILTVESHHDGGLVDWTEEISGTYRNLEADWHLWAVVQVADGDFWVQECVPIDGPDGEWVLDFRLGRASTGDIGGSYRILVLAVKQGSDAERYLRGFQGDLIQELPTGQVHVFDPGITLVRSGPTGHWLADFWDNDAWEGDPLATQTITSTFLFQEWIEAPFEGMPEAGWTARFVRRIQFSGDGEYCFYRVQDDRVDVSIDGEELDIPQDARGRLGAGSACRELDAGDHDVRVDLANLMPEYGVVQFWYDGPGVEVPRGPLTETWQATFFPTTDLKGKPVWVTSLPGPFLSFRGTVSSQAPVVRFGAIFSRTLTVTKTATYRFELDLDDGARFEIDGQSVLDEWHNGPAACVVERRLDPGDHSLRVEYYEYFGDQYVTLTWRETSAPVPPVERVLFASDRDGDYEIYVVDANGANPVKLTDNGYPDHDPAWSPDGQKVVFAADPNSDGVLSLYVWDGSKEPEPLGVDGYQPRWSPDGSRIAYAAGGEGVQEIYVVDADGMDADGANRVQLTNNQAADYSPDWSPDGSRIAFETDRDGNQEIYVVNADGTAPVNLSQSPDTWDGTPAWSPDGSSIAFSSYRDGNTDIYLMDPDGSRQRRVTWLDSENKFPDWSADGRYLVFEGTDLESGYSQIYRNRVGYGTTRLPLTECNARQVRPQWSPPGYGYGFENLTDGDDVEAGALVVSGDYVWTGGNGGVVRWNRDDPEQQQKFTSEDGLAENSAGAILATDGTTLWFGTGGWPFGGSGLSRYEFDAGHERWRTYTAGDGLGSDTVFGLYQDSQGTIWAGTKEGARKFDGLHWEGFEGQEGDWVMCTHETPDGVFWFCLSNTGVMRYDPSASGGAAWQRFNLKDLLGSDNDGYKYASAIVDGAPGELWIATNSGVVYYDGETWQPAGGALDVWTSAAVRDVDGGLWFGADNGLVRLDAGSQHVYTTEDGLTGIVRALVVDDAGVLWAAGNGLNRYDRENDRWLGYRTQGDQAINYASAIAQDKDDALWFGHSMFYYNYTWDGGVSRYVPSGDGDGRWQRFDTDDGLSDNAVHVIHQARDGVVWVGFDREGGGVCRYDVTRRRWLSCYREDAKGLVSDMVDSIVQTGDGALWFGTSGGGISRFDGERWETFTQANSGLLSNEVHCLAEDSEGALWVTTDQGVNRFFYDTGRWVPFITRNSDIIADEVLAVAMDGDDGVWLGTAEGLSRYDVGTRRWRTVEDVPALPGWVDHCTQRMTVDQYGTVWVGTGEGLYRSTSVGGWLRLTTADGLASNQVLAVFGNADDTLWIGTPSGVSRLRVEE